MVLSLDILDFPLAAEAIRGCAFYPNATDAVALGRRLGVDRTALSNALTELQNCGVLSLGEVDGAPAWELHLNAEQIEKAKEAAELYRIKQSALRPIDIAGRLQWLDSLTAMIECARRSCREDISKT